MIPLPTTNLPNGYGVDVSSSTFKSDGRFGAGREIHLIPERQFLRGTEANTTQDDDSSCFETSDSGAVTLTDEEGCKARLLVQPIIMAIFTIVLVFLCLWCRFKKRKQESALAIATLTMRAQGEQEQREAYRRQLPVMASQRRRERELHRIQLETNSRLEKMEGRNAEETNARRMLLLEKFKKAGLEKVSHEILPIAIGSWKVLV